MIQRPKNCLAGCSVVLGRISALFFAGTRKRLRGMDVVWPDEGRTVSREALRKARSPNRSV